MTPAAMRRKIEAFFRRYAATYACGLADRPGVDKAVAAAFADYFVASSPAGVHGGRNGVVFRLMLKRGFARYRKLGVEAMTVDELDITPLDGLHAMARVRWDSRTRRRSDGRTIRIRFAHHYFLTLADDKPRIFAYVATDEQAILKKHGLI